MITVDEFGWREKTQRASQAKDKSLEGVETTWDVNHLNNRQERPLPDQVTLKVKR
jgi:hypothetical protein